MERWNVPLILDIEVMRDPNENNLFMDSAETSRIV